MQNLSYHSLILLLFTVLLISPTIAKTSNQKNTLKNRINLESLQIPFEKNTIIIDGELNDDLWSNALSIKLDIVNSPWNNLPSPVKTTAKLIQNGKFLYISFIAYDPDPTKIQGFLTDRDKTWLQDTVGIKLDTHNNRRLNYSFFVNPYGVQNDATYNEITGKNNTSWDGLWYAFGKITEQGYQVEMAIPYNILNFKADGKKKKWAIELVRIYPRDTSLRISHVPLERDNPCWLCQYPEATGFEEAEIGQNLRLIPRLTASRDETRDIYANSNDPNSDWSGEKDIEAGVDLRWGINANNLLNATLNPDFSTVESDSGQLSVNTNFSLFYEEKRAFFLDNSDYFSSDFDLIYTRNIAVPDYGAKLTGRIDKHSYGAFITNDTETNILLPGNLRSSLMTLAQESHAGALRYRYDYNNDLTIGTLATLRTADDYHNYVVGLDARYRLSQSSTIKAQVLNSETLYPKTFNNSADPSNDSFSDHAFKLNFNHDSEYWLIDLDHQNIGADFRADLGFMPKVDIKTDDVFVKRVFYSSPDSQWQEAGVAGEWKIIHNINNELIERLLTASFSIDGPMQSFYELSLIHGEKVGIRYDDTIADIDGNTSSFNEDQIELYANIKPNTRTFLSLELTMGDKIDYANDRLGDLIEIEGNVAVFLTDHLEFDFYQTYSELDSKNSTNSNNNVYVAHISELRLSYQFDVQSYLKLSLVYSDVNRNPDNNNVINSMQSKSLSSQLIYAYKLNPQTVFFLGYSDNSFRDDDVTKLTLAERTFFTKISYAWSP
ncbi:carbohydrate binding family 9 domain-containing protein [Candidatus Colwellia aromaticivorans]|uniref:carbohydrate binding family 9 domain-containing protein n=1 Tax=Candidatus Colwellia aromaticivorans TaxID=2267621 RepID=UPI000DF27A5E|nr:carbohydrate binding family 9 domain-containing protein [Candidatus Colwellia aromaticivorans]